jgi:hypothetical protein
MRFAMTAKHTQLHERSKGHQRIPSATSVMDPLASSTSCVAIDDPTSRLLRKVGLPSVSSLRSARQLLWQASDINDDDVVLFVSLLDECEAPLLCALYLNDNLISDRGLLALLQCQKLTTLRHLSLGRNLLTDGGVHTLVLALEPGAALASVRELNLRGNPLTVSVRDLLRQRHDQNHMFVAA